MTNQAINSSDMIGILGLSISNAELEDFNSISLMVQNEVTKQILGDDLYNQFTTDFDAGSGTPTEQKNLDLLNGVTYTDTINFDYDKSIISDGLKECWKYFTYYEWLNQAPFVSNFIGKSVHNTTNSTVLDRQSLNIETQNRYNLGTEKYSTTSCFLDYYKDYEVDYTNISEVAGTYTVLLPDTTYLKVGDTITIDSIDYVVTVLTANTSFEFVAATGITFVTDYVSWTPFYKVALGSKDPIYFNGLF
jgi:hypothetical protein